MKKYLIAFVFVFVVVVGYSQEDSYEYGIWHGSIEFRDSIGQDFVLTPFSEVIGTIEFTDDDTAQVFP